jgi:hypothetical protein
MVIDMAAFGVNYILYPAIVIGVVIMLARLFPMLKEMIDKANDVANR